MSTSSRIEEEKNMSNEKAMEYCRLNLQRCALKPNSEDKANINLLKDHFQTMKSADAAVVEMKEFSGSRFFHFSNMGLLYWAVVCVSLLALPLSDYLESGAVYVAPGLFWPAYILPAILLGIRLFFGMSTVNIAHIALAAVCAVLTFLKIRIFGSEYNWAWVFIVVGTVITIIGRVWEYKTELEPNLDKHNQLRTRIMNGEKSVNEASSVFASIGASAEQQLRGQFPGANLPAKDPWFAFDRTSTGNTPKTYKISEVNTDFETKKHNYHKIIPDTQSTTYRFAVVTDQKLDFEMIDRETAKRYISEKKVVPFFGLTERTGDEDLHYLIYVHRWSESQHDLVHVNYDKTDYTYTGEKSKAARDMSDNEWSALGMDAESFMLRTDSAAAREYAREYISRRDSKLNSMSDYRSRTRHVEYTSEYDRDVTYEHIATLSVLTSDGEPVALYCADNRQAIAFAEKMAKDYWNAGITPGCAAQSPAQAAYLYQRYLN